MGDLAFGTFAICGHTARGFVASEIIDVISCVGWVGGNQPLPIPRAFKSYLTIGMDDVLPP